MQAQALSPGELMADIFLSYASEDRERVIPLVEALQADGFSVWWDRTIQAGNTYDREIEAAIGEAACMVVVWSANWKGAFIIDPRLIPNRLCDRFWWVLHGSHRRGASRRAARGDATS